MKIVATNKLSFDEFNAYFNEFKTEMFNERNTLKKEIEKLKNINEELLKENSKLKLDNASLQERYNKMVAAKYQSQRNNVIFDMPTLFDDIEEEALKS